jgi:hypothetical protein
MRFLLRPSTHAFRGLFDRTSCFPCLIGREEGLEEGRYEKAIAIDKNLLAEGISPESVQKLTGIFEKEVIILVRIL